MIKAILFDLDGVLVDARELHYEALNMALGIWFSCCCLATKHRGDKMPLRDADGAAYLSRRDDFPRTLRESTPLNIPVLVN